MAYAWSEANYLPSRIVEVLLCETSIGELIALAFLSLFPQDRVHGPKLPDDTTSTAARLDNPNPWIYPTRVPFPWSTAPGVAFMLTLTVFWSCGRVGCRGRSKSKIDFGAWDLSKSLAQRSPTVFPIISLLTYRVNHLAGYIYSRSYPAIPEKPVRSHKPCHEFWSQEAGFSASMPLSSSISDVSLVVQKHFQEVWTVLVLWWQVWGTFCFLGPGAAFHSSYLKTEAIVLKLRIVYLFYKRFMSL